MKGAESEQPVGAPFYHWVGCRDHAIACLPHSGSGQAQGGPAYIERDQRKCVFHNMGPFKVCCLTFEDMISRSSLQSRSSRICVVMQASFDTHGLLKARRLFWVTFFSRSKFSQVSKHLNSHLMYANQSIYSTERGLYGVIGSFVAVTLKSWEDFLAEWNV